MAFADKFWELVTQAGSVVITSHKSPDDDAIASVLAMYWIVTKKFPEKKVEMVYTGEAVTDGYVGLPNYGRIRFVDDFCRYAENYDLIIMVDASRKDRVGVETEKLTGREENMIVIDHHPDDEDGFGLKLVNKEKVASTEIILEELGGKIEALDKELAGIFLLGILGDCGDLTFVEPGFGGVFETVRKLLAVLGTSIQKFLMEYETIPGRLFVLIKELVANTSFTEANNGWPRYQTSFLPRETAEKGAYTDAEISRARTFYSRKMFPWLDGCRLLMVFMPRRNGDCYVSLRSNIPEISVRTLAVRMGMGNGHDFAAAMVFPGNGGKVSIEPVIERVKKWMEKNSPED